MVSHCLPVCTFPNLTMHVTADITYRNLPYAYTINASQGLDSTVNLYNHVCVRT